MVPQPFGILKPMQLEAQPHVNGKVAPVASTRWIPLVKADQETLRRIWPRVRRGCLAVKAKANGKRSEGIEWTPEHVRAQLEMGFQGRSTAELWQIMNRKGEMIGFLVTIIGNCPYLQVPISLITWISYGFQPVPGAIKRAVLVQLEQYTRDLGVRYKDGYSTNFAWLKWLDRYGSGYRIAQILYRKDVWTGK